MTEPAYEEDGTVSDLWLVAVDGDEEPRWLTASNEAESGVACSGTRKRGSHRPLTKDCSISDTTDVRNFEFKILQ